MIENQNKWTLHKAIYETIWIKKLPINYTARKLNKNVWIKITSNMHKPPEMKQNSKITIKNNKHRKECNAKQTIFNSTSLT